MPQVIVGALMLLNVVYTLAKHGQPRAAHNIYAVIVSTFFWFVLLGFAGFWG